MTAEEFDAVVAQVRRDRCFEDIIRREEATQHVPEHDTSDLEWNPYV